MQAIFTGAEAVAWKTDILEGLVVQTRVPLSKAAAFYVRGGRYRFWYDVVITRLWSRTDASDKS